MPTLLTNTVPSKEPCILDVNLQIQKLAPELQRQGRRVAFAEMHCEQGYPDRPVAADISPDGTHPFDHGYELMVDIFFEAFLQADKRGFLRIPEQNGIPEDGELERINEPLLFEPPPPPKKPRPAPQPVPTSEDKNKAEKTDTKASDTVDAKTAGTAADTKAGVVNAKGVLTGGTAADTETGAGRGRNAGIHPSDKATPAADTKAAPVPGLTVRDNGDMIFDGEKVRIVIGGAAEKPKGMGVDVDGNILDGADNKMGLAGPWGPAVDAAGTITKTGADPKPAAGKPAITPVEIKTDKRWAKRSLLYP